MTIMRLKNAGQYFLAMPLLLAFSALETRAAEPLKASAVIHGSEDGGEISRHLYGHFAEHLGGCIYDGIWVGEDSAIPNVRGMRKDIVDALRELDIPNLRWPGGCYADDYHWRDGIGPRGKRPQRVNLHWGQVIDTNAFGTHEFLDLCEQIGAEPYIAGNVGSGTPQELRDWIEYMTFDGNSELANLRRANGRDKPWKIRYVGIGNENWGCGGDMTPEYYSDLYRRYAVFARDLGDNRLVRVACGPGGLNQQWARVVMDRVGRRMQALSVHFYTVVPNWENKTPATGFGEKEWFDMVRECLQMERAIRESETEMDRVDPRRRIAMFVDEWGSWYRTEDGHPGYSLYQQNSIRDAVLAGLTFHIFHEHCERVRMANIAQTVNVLQAMVLTDKERMLLTPTYHVFEMYKVHHDATRLPVKLTSPDYAYGGNRMPALSVSASRSSDGTVHLSIVNAHATQPVQLSCELNEISASVGTGRILTAEKLDGHNTFDKPQQVMPKEFQDASIEAGKLGLNVPARSVIVLRLSK